MTYPYCSLKIEKDNLRFSKKGQKVREELSSKGINDEAIEKLNPVFEMSGGKEEKVGEGFSFWFLQYIN